MPTDITNPMIAFTCGHCMGHGETYSSKPDYATMKCVQCSGTGKIRLTIDDLAERIARKIHIPSALHMDTSG